jgi:hypothetical protein
LSQLVSSSCTLVHLSFQWYPWDPGGRTGARSTFEGHPHSESKIKKLSPFQIANNQLS